MFFCFLSESIDCERSRLGASISKAVLEIEANAVIYVHTYIFTSKNPKWSRLRVQATQAGLVRDLNWSAVKPSSLASTKKKNGKTETKRVLDILRMPKLMSVNCKKTSQQLPSRSCVITTKDSLFFKMFPLLFCFEQVKTLPKLMSVNCKKTSQQLPSRSCVITTKDSLFCKMFPPLFCFEQVKTLKNFSRKLFTSKIKKEEEEEETKSSVWDFKTPKLAQIHQHSSGSRQVCLSVRPIIKAHFQIWEEHFGFWEISGENSEKIRKVSLLEQITQLTHAPSSRTEWKYTKSQPLSPTLLSGAKLFGHVSHSIPSLYPVFSLSTIWLQQHRLVLR